MAHRLRSPADTLAGLPASCSRSQLPASEREISVDCMSYKDSYAKHTKNYGNHFKHFDGPLLLVRVKADPGFMLASSGRKVVSITQPIKVR